MTAESTGILTESTIDPTAIPRPVPADHQGIFEPVHLPVETADPDLIYAEAEAAKAAELDVTVQEGVASDPGYTDWQNRELRLEALRQATAILAGSASTTSILIRNAGEIEAYLRDGIQPANAVA